MEARRRLCCAGTALAVSVSFSVGEEVLTISNKEPDAARVCPINSVSSTSDKSKEYLQFLQVLTLGFLRELCCQDIKKKHGLNETSMSMMT